MMCCNRPSIQTMDYLWPIFGDEQENRINRVCMNCFAHWAGAEDDITQYTKNEWDALISTAFREEI